MLRRVTVVVDIEVEGKELEDSEIKKAFEHFFTDNQGINSYEVDGSDSWDVIFEGVVSVDVEKL